jgi:hypothetical protein
MREVAKRAGRAAPFSHRLLARWLVFGGIALSGLVSGCGGSGAAAEYAKVTGCDPDEVSVRSLGSNQVERFYAQGCGQNREIQCWNGKCRSPAYEVQTRHAREFGCHRNDVTAIDREEGHFVADGCGHQLSYLCAFDEISVVRCDAERK